MQNTMPDNLRHARNDAVPERIYIGRRFKNDAERLGKLFDLYANMTTAAQLRPKKSVPSALKVESKGGC